MGRSNKTHEIATFSGLKWMFFCFKTTSLETCFSNPLQKNLGFQTSTKSKNKHSNYWEIRSYHKSKTEIEILFWRFHFGLRKQGSLFQVQDLKKLIFILPFCNRSRFKVHPKFSNLKQVLNISNTLKALVSLENLSFFLQYFQV